MVAAPAPTGPAQAGLVVVRRLHRLVRAGYRPWLGYDVASGLDAVIELHIKGSVATLHPDGAVAFSAGPGARSGQASAPPHGSVIAGDDAEGFDAAFPPNAPNTRNLMRRLYEMGF